MVTLSPIGAGDFAEWAPLWDGYLAFYKTSVTDIVRQTTFGRLTGGAEPMGGFIARDADGRAVGLVHWIRHRSCWTIADYIYLQDLFVDPAHRGGGVGRKLIEAVYDLAKSAGLARVHWLTHETNQTAMKLYDQVAERPGFVQYRKVIV